MNLEQLRAIAASINAVRGDASHWRPFVSFAVSNTSRDAILALGGEGRAHVYAPDCHVIDSAKIVVDGVEFHAQSEARAATEEEIAREVVRVRRLKGEGE